MYQSCTNMNAEAVAGCFPEDVRFHQVKKHTEFQTVLNHVNQYETDLVDEDRFAAMVTSIARNGKPQQFRDFVTDNDEYDFCKPYYKNVLKAKREFARENMKERFPHQQIRGYYS